MGEQKVVARRKADAEERERQLLRAEEDRKLEAARQCAVKYSMCSPGPDRRGSFTREHRMFSDKNITTDISINKTKGEYDALDAQYNLHHAKLQVSGPIEPQECDQQKPIKPINTPVHGGRTSRRNQKRRGDIMAAALASGNLPSNPKT